MTAFKLIEMKANLFHIPQTCSLAHTVSANFDASHQGSLAWQFAVIFGQMDELKKRPIEVGNVVVLEDNSRFVYFLITKENFYDSCTYDTLQSALICMREHMRNHGDLKVAMPRIGCHSDNLDWHRVKNIIQKVFVNEYGVEILICQYDAPVMLATPKCQIVEVKGNLFSAPAHYSLVHSVSADFALCKGISLQFKCKYGQANDLAKQNKHTGNVAVLKEHDRYVYNLITKERSHEKCTYPALYYALFAMREHMLEHNVTKLAIPRLGCGMDRLQWLNVRKILEFVFYNDNVEIIAYFYDPPTVEYRKSMTNLHSPHCKRFI